jgi:enamine deaminase RidA (YjgF/YER057c/UK114 family)
VTFQIFNPPELGAHKGWNNGILAPAGGRILFVAGQEGWEESAQGRPPDFAEQFAHALDKVLAVVRAAGGAPTDIARLTIYTTSLDAYTNALKPLGEAWRARLQTYYPAVALVEVKGLVAPACVVEIEATAVIGGGGA